MNEASNVVRLPFAGSAPPPQGQGGMGPGMVAFVDIADLDEARLFEIVLAHGVASLIDARPVSVFERPRFRHREVVHRLYANDVAYVEMMMLATWPAKDRVLGTFDAAVAGARIAEAVAKGFSLCVYDTPSREKGWLEETRRLVRTSQGYVGEIHPRSVLPRQGPAGAR